MWLLVKEGSLFFFFEVFSKRSFYRMVDLHLNVLYNGLFKIIFIWHAKSAPPPPRKKWIFQKVKKFTEIWNKFGHVIKPVKLEKLLRRFDHALHVTRFIPRWTFFPCLSIIFTLEGKLFKIPNTPWPLCLQLCNRQTINLRGDSLSRQQYDPLTH